MQTELNRIQYFFNTDVFTFGIRPIHQFGLAEVSLLNAFVWGNVFCVSLDAVLAEVSQRLCFHLPCCAWNSVSFGKTVLKKSRIFLWRSWARNGDEIYVGSV